MAPTHCPTCGTELGGRSICPRCGTLVGAEGRAGAATEQGKETHRHSAGGAPGVRAGTFSLGLRFHTNRDCTAACQLRHRDRIDAPAQGNHPAGRLRMDRHHFRTQHHCERAHSVQISFLSVGTIWVFHNFCERLARTFLEYLARIEACVTAHYSDLTRQLSRAWSYS